MTIEGYEGERMLLSYDVSGSARSVAAQVAQIVFGRVRVSEAKGRIRYLEKGFIHLPGVVWIGQSVLVLPPPHAQEPPHPPPSRERGSPPPRGVVWIGQPALVLPPADAEELGDRLRRLGVRVAVGHVDITRGTIEAFRRRRRLPA